MEEETTLFFSLQQQSPVFVQPAIPKKEQRGKKEGEEKGSEKGVSRKTMTAQGHSCTSRCVCTKLASDRQKMRQGACRWQKHVDKMLLPFSSPHSFS